ncbi:MAG: hypothetical protein NZ580_04730 [Bacteroidia bacterium]|nr:hypothetical protein [Bacteroidia bacterium]MDW8236256.1 hypothetical protein [Bacteroidia bacterium]
MRAVGFGLLWGAACLSLFFPAGSPAVEATYHLTSLRWKEGSAHPYRDLPGHGDLVWFALYKYFPASSPYLLRLWKGWGIGAMGLFLWRTAAPSVGLLIGLGWLALSSLRPWETALAVGEPALWTLLLIAHYRPPPFLQGILWGFTALLFPPASLALLWSLYRDIEEQTPLRIPLTLLGGGWAVLVGTTLLQMGGYLPFYWLRGWLALWQEWQPSLLALKVLGFLLLWLLSAKYLYRPYSDRKMSRDRLWAGIVSIGAPTIGLFPSLIWVEFPWQGWQRFGVGIWLLLQGGEAVYSIGQRPSCTYTLPKNSCFWGSPSCYIQSPSYACGWTAPHAWRLLWKNSPWQQRYHWWQQPQFILDAAHVWSETHYFLPYLSRPYIRADTTWRGIPLYYRR